MPDGAEPSVSLVIAAHREAPIIAAKVANARELDWPAERLEVIVACDGSPDDTPARARAAGADVVLELPWGGKVRAQDAAVERAGGELLAFSDANALWEPGALRALAAAFADDRVGYACGQVRFVNDGGTNQEGLYWRYEMAIRARESQLQSVTAGNGAIYAVRPEAYLRVDPIMGHDLSLPFNMVKRGWRAVYAPAARAVEKMVPTVEGEFARKRRMMSHAWPIVLRGGLLSPRGYPPLYALMVASHRLLRYATPFLHLVALAANAALLGEGWVYVATFAIQIAVLAGGARRARGAACARCWSPATTCSPPPRWRPGCGTTCATARRPAGPRPRARADGAPRLRRGRRRLGAARRRRPSCSRRSSPSAWSRAAARSTASGAWARTAARSTCSSCARWSPAPSTWAPAWPSARATRASRASGACCAARRSTRCPTWSTSCAARWRSSARARRSPSRSTATPSASAGAWRSSPGITGWAQVNGRTELPWDERIELDLWYIEHRSWRLDLRILLLTVRMVFGGDGLYRGEAPAWRDPPSDS